VASAGASASASAAASVPPATDFSPSVMLFWVPPTRGLRVHDPPEHNSYERELTYSASEYRHLLLSYSGHRAMEPDSQRGLLLCIVRLIDERYGGQIAKRYMNELAVAYLS
jgi:hypothetical protein